MIQQLVNSLTYDKTVSISIIQYIFLIGVIVGAVATNPHDKGLYACTAIAIVVQALIWGGIHARGISLVYSILLGYMTLRRSKEETIRHKLPEWIIWSLVFVLVNVISILTVNWGGVAIMIMTIAHCAGFALGICIAGIIELIER